MGRAKRLNNKVKCMNLVKGDKRIKMNRECKFVNNEANRYANMLTSILLPLPTHSRIILSTVKRGREGEEVLQ